MLTLKVFCSEKPLKPTGGNSRSSNGLRFWGPMMLTQPERLALAATTGCGCRRAPLLGDWLAALFAAVVGESNDLLWA